MPTSSERSITRFTVVWEDGTENQLAEFWNDALNRREVSKAADQIDHELATDAHHKGLDLSEGLRCLKYSPWRHTILSSLTTA